MFPCPKCGPPAVQVQSLYDYWVANGVNVTLLWLDIEGSEYWLGDAGHNQVCRRHHRPNPPSPLQPCAPHLVQAWYAQLFDACSSMHLDFGVYGARSRLDLPASFHNSILYTTPLMPRSVALAVERNLWVAVLRPRPP